MSEDPQGGRWWLASDGKWYPPDLHPDFRGMEPDEQDRNAALLNATIGVAMVRERVFAEVHADRRTAPLQDDETGPRNRVEPKPRFRGRVTPAPPVEALTGRVTGEEPPPARADVGLSSGKPEPAPAVVEGVPRFNHAAWPESTAPVEPAEALDVSSTGSQAPPPSPGVAAPAWPPAGRSEVADTALVTPAPVPSPVPPESSDTVLVTPAPVPSPVPPESSDTVLVTPPPPSPEPQAVLVTPPSSPASQASPTVPASEERVIPAQGRRRPAKIRSNADLRDAVAEAVARAAAQGPLTPRGPEGEAADPYEELARLATEEALAESTRSDDDDAQDASVTERTTGGEGARPSPDLVDAGPSVQSDWVAVEAVSLEWETRVSTTEDAQAERTEDEQAEPAGLEDTANEYLAPESSAIEQPTGLPALELGLDDSRTFNLDEPGTEQASAEELSTEAAALAEAAAAEIAALQATGVTIISETAAGEVSEDAAAVSDSLADETAASAPDEGVAADGVVARAAGEVPLTGAPGEQASTTEASPEQVAAGATEERAEETLVTDASVEEALATKESTEGVEGEVAGEKSTEEALVTDGPVAEVAVSAAEEAPVRAVATEDSPREALSATETSADEAAAEEAPAEEAPAEEAPAEEAPAEEIAGEAVVSEGSAEDAPRAEASADATATEALAEEAAGEAAGTEEALVTDGSAEEALAAEASADEAAVTEALAEEVAAETTADETASERVTSEQAAAAEPAWPFGERRSAARQARKPLPAALQEAVAAGAAQDLGEAGASASGRSSEPSSRSQGAGPDSRASGKDPDKDDGTDKPPGVIRRYGSAIAIVVLFLAAGGVAAGIAAFHGPVTPGQSSDQTAANRAVLSATDFPAGWHVSDPGNDATSYGLGAALVRPTTVRNWLARHASCSTALRAVSASMTPSGSGLTAVAYSTAATTNSGGGPWQIADAVAFHSSAARVSANLAGMRSLIGQRRTQLCVSQFFADSLQATEPVGSLVVTSVSPNSLPALPGSPTGWGMVMTGKETAGSGSLPISFEFVSFAVGRVQVFFAASSKSAPLPASIVSSRLAMLANRAAGDHPSSTSA